MRTTPPKRPPGVSGKGIKIPRPGSPGGGKVLTPKMKASPGGKPAAKPPPK